MTRGEGRQLPGKASDHRAAPLEQLNTKGTFKIVVRLQRELNKHCFKDMHQTLPEVVQNTNDPDANGDIFQSFSPSVSS